MPSLRPVLISLVQEISTLQKTFILRTLLVNDALVFICIVCYVDRNHKWINLYVRSMINMNIFHK